MHLTQTGKHPKDMKAGLIEKIRGLVSEFQRVFVFRYDNMRTNKFKELRTEWSDSRCVLGAQQQHACRAARIGGVSTHPRAAGSASGATR